MKKYFYEKSKFSEFKSNKTLHNLKLVLKENLKDIKKKWPGNIPKGIIHGDLFIDNIFFNKNKFAGFIDFYFSSNDYLMYEIAICINALCFDKKNNKFILNNKKISSGTSDDALQTMKLVYKIYFADKKWQQTYDIENPEIK